MTEIGDDEMRIIWVDVTNPEGVTFPAVLGHVSKAGVTSFYVLPEDAPPGEVSGERCEHHQFVPLSYIFHPTVPHPDVRVYRFAAAARNSTAGNLDERKTR
jgi:hypothetical protein